MVRVAFYFRKVVIGNMIILLQFLAESKGEKIVKIGQHFPKLWTNNIVGGFMTHSVYANRGTAQDHSQQIQLPVHKQVAIS